MGLISNPSVTTPVLAGFGDGADGDVTISGNTTLTRVMYYNTLTVNGSVTLTTSGYVIYVKGTCTITGAIADPGSAASGATGGAALAGGTGGNGVAGVGGNGGVAAGSAGGAVNANSGAGGGAAGGAGGSGLIIVDEFYN